MRTLLTFVPPPAVSICDMAGRVLMWVKPVITWRRRHNNTQCSIVVNYGDTGSDDWIHWATEAVGFEEVDGRKLATPGYLRISASKPFRYFVFSLAQDGAGCTLKEGEDGEEVELDAKSGGLVDYLIQECHRHTMV